MITIFRTFYDQTPYHIEIDKALNRIRDGKSERLVKWVNEVTGAEFTQRKKQLPCILFAGTFNQRSIAGMVEHSGFICLDFDKFPDTATLEAWKDTLEGHSYTYSVFVSPSGNGLKCIVRIPPTDYKGLMTDYKGHKAYFRGLQNYYNCEYFDKGVFDVSRICFESFDPTLTINRASEVWTGQIFDPEPVIIPYNKASLSDQETVRRLLKWADRKFPIVEGCRNANLYRLTCSLNDFGIDKEYALSICSQFQADDFKIGEIEITVNSAFKKVHKHGCLKF